jgi:hypothetical protein
VITTMKSTPEQRYRRVMLALGVASASEAERLTRIRAALAELGSLAIDVANAALPGYEQTVTDLLNEVETLAEAVSDA